MNFCVAHQASINEDATSPGLAVASILLVEPEVMPPRSVFFLALAASLMLAMGCDQGIEPGRSTPTILPVRATAVQHRASFDYQITYYGRIEPARRAKLSFERAGRLTQVVVEEGERVASGQVVARLDTSQLEAEKNVLLSRRKTESVMLGRLRRGERVEVIAAARAETMRLEVELSRALADSNRAEQGYSTNTVSRAEVEQLLHTYQAAVYSLQQAKHRLEELESGSRSEDVEAQESRVAVIDAQLKLLDVQFEQSVLVAPFGCITIQRFQDEGVTLSPGQFVLEIDEANRFEARFSIPFANVDLIGQTKYLQINGKSYLISAARAISKIDDMMRTVDVLIPLRIETKDRILPGQTCTITLTKQVKSDCFELPISALVASIRGLWSCYQLRPNPSQESLYTVEKVDLSIIHSDGERAIVAASLDDGSLVVSEGVHRMVQGMHVRVVEGAR